QRCMVVAAAAYHAGRYPGLAGPLPDRLDDCRRAGQSCAEPPGLQFQAIAAGLATHPSRPGPEAAVRAAYPVRHDTRAAQAAAGRVGRGTGLARPWRQSDAVVRTVRGGLSA